MVEQSVLPGAQDGGEGNMTARSVATKQLALTREGKTND